LVGVIAILGFFAYMLSVRMEMSTYYRNGIYKMNCTVGNTQNPPERIWICGEEQNFNIITFTGNDLTFQ
jgi:hypothetical protein